MPPHTTAVHSRTAPCYPAWTARGGTAHCCSLFMYVNTTGVSSSRSACRSHLHAAALRAGRPVHRSLLRLSDVPRPFVQRHVDGCRYTSMSTCLHRGLHLCKRPCARAGRPSASAAGSDASARRSRQVCCRDAASVTSVYRCLLKASLSRRCRLCFRFCYAFIRCVLPLFQRVATAPCSTHALLAAPASGWHTKGPHFDHVSNVTM